jgi:peroxiredoxin Q/BCP
MTMPAVGTLAPDFTLDTDAGTPLTLSALRGRPVVLFFYPRDNTPGCTLEACSFRDALPRFDTLGATVLGISPDTARKHANFRKKFNLSYPLLADVGHAVAEQYGVWAQKTFWGRKYWGVERTTFVVDRDGRIAHVFEKVNPLGHAAQVAEAVAALG